MVLDLSDEFAVMLDDESSDNKLVEKTYKDISNDYIESAKKICNVETFYGIKTNKLMSLLNFNGTKLMNWNHVTMFIDSSKLYDISGEPAEEIRVFDFVEEIDTIMDKNGLGYNNYISNKIKTVIIPKSVALINDTVFAFYKKLQTLTFESGSELLFLGERQFCYCTKLNVVDLTPCRQLEQIGKNMFSGSTVKTVKFPSSIKEMHKDTFKNSVVKTVYIDNTKYTMDEFVENLKNNKYKAFWNTDEANFDF